MIAQQDVRALTPDYIERMLPAARDHEAGRLLLQPAVRRAHRRGARRRKLLALYADMGRALARFSGWRAACFVANPNFVDAFGHAPIMTKPASNADLRGAFLVYQL